MNLIYLLLRSSWRIVAIAVLTGLISGASSARLIALINNAINSDRADITTLIWNFAALLLVVIVTGIISQVFLIRLSQGVIFDLQMRLSRKILSTALRHLEELGAPKLLASLTDDVQAISGAVFVIPFICIDLAVVIGCLIYLSWLSWLVFLVMLCFLIVAIASVQFLIKKGDRFLASGREQQDLLFKHFRSLTEGTKELKLHASRRQAFLSKELQSTAATRRHYRVIGLTVFAIATNWGQLLFFFVIGLLLFGLPRLTSISSSILSSYILTLTYLMLPLRSILEILPNLSNASVALRKIDALGLSLDSQAEEIFSVDRESMLGFNQLELIGVTHTYRLEREESNFTIGPIDLIFSQGELVFIVGGNGSGKSTLAKLIVGLYIPESGEIKFNDKPIANQNREWYRQQFSVVFSDFYLFEQLLGLNNPDLDSKIKDYLIQLHLEHKVQVKDGILSTTALSQGQRKRLALLTAYLEDRPIYLFDEWASDQDPVFKEIFYTQLLPNLKNRGKTVLVISHDDRYFYLGDRIVKLDYGKVEYDKRSHL